MDCSPLCVTAAEFVMGIGEMTSECQIMGDLYASAQVQFSDCNQIHFDY